MSNYLNNLVAKSLGSIHSSPTAVARPRLASVFEPLSGVGGAAVAAATVSGATARARQPQPQDNRHSEASPSEALTSQPTGKPARALATQEAPPAVWRGRLDAPAAAFDVGRAASDSPAVIADEASAPAAMRQQSQRQKAALLPDSSPRSTPTTPAGATDDSHSSRQATTGERFARNLVSTPATGRHERESQRAASAPVVSPADNFFGDDQTHSAEAQAKPPRRASRQDGRQALLPEVAQPLSRSTLDAASETADGARQRDGAASPRRANRIVARPRSSFEAEAPTRGEATGIALPSSPQSQLAQEAPAMQPTISVTIGRIEIKATPSAPQPRQRPQAAGAPILSLDEYLRKRHSGGESL